MQPVRPTSQAARVAPPRQFAPSALTATIYLPPSPVAFAAKPFRTASLATRPAAACPVPQAATL